MKVEKIILFISILIVTGCPAPGDKPFWEERTITLDLPRDDVYVAGRTYTLSWDDLPGDKVSIELLEIENGKYKFKKHLAESWDKNKPFNWTVPDHLISPHPCKIRVTIPGGPFRGSCQGESAPFYIHRSRWEELPLLREGKNRKVKAAVTKEGEPVIFYDEQWEGKTVLYVKQWDSHTGQWKDVGNNPVFEDNSGCAKYLSLELTGEDIPVIAFRGTDTRAVDNGFQNDPDFNSSEIQVKKYNNGIWELAGESSAWLTKAPPVDDQYADNLSFGHSLAINNDAIYLSMFAAHIDLHEVPENFFEISDSLDLDVDISFQGRRLVNGAWEDNGSHPVPPNHYVGFLLDILSYGGLVGEIDQYTTTVMDKENNLYMAYNTYLREDMRLNVFLFAGENGWQKVGVRNGLPIASRARHPSLALYNENTLALSYGKQMIGDEKKDNNPQGYPVIKTWNKETGWEDRGFPGAHLRGFPLICAGPGDTLLTATENGLWLLKKNKWHFVANTFKLGDFDTWSINTGGGQCVLAFIEKDRVKIKRISLENIHEL